MASRLVLRSLKNINGAANLSRFATPTVVQANLRLPLAFSINTNTRCFSASSIILQKESSNILKDLSSFLTQEIKQESDNRKYKSGLPKVSGFSVKTEGPNATLTKTHDSENITVKFNINGSLDDSEPHMDEQMDPEKAKNDAEAPQMKSRPPFTIDIAKGGQVLSFGCSFLAAEEGVKDSVEDFQIDEFAIHNGEWNENVFTADCSVLDGNLYDILLSLLEERGMGEQFANELAEFSTAFEHSQYIGLLEKLQKFSK